MAGDNGAILHAIAAFVRERGANALIYPSARSDVLVESRLRRVQKWRGWCLVDYAGASEPLIAQAHDFSCGWCTKFPKGAWARIAPEDGEFSGSFEVNGIVEWNRDRVSEREKEFIQLQSSGSQTVQVKRT